MSINLRKNTENTEIRGFWPKVGHVKMNITDLLGVAFTNTHADEGDQEDERHRAHHG